MAIQFCAHLARAIRDGLKTTTWKPLSVADNARRIAGYTSDDVYYAPGTVLAMQEPWGLVGADITFASSFTPARRSDPATQPAGWRGMGNRADVELTVTSCELRQLATLTEQDAQRAGTIPPDGDTYLAEFERQWRGAYSGAQAWDANPYCWLITFTVNA